MKCITFSGPSTKVISHLMCCSGTGSSKKYYMKCVNNVYEINLFSKGSGGGMIVQLNGSLAEKKKIENIFSMKRRTFAALRDLRKTDLSNIFLRGEKK